jgi:hypothetical protein
MDTSVWLRRMFTPSRATLLLLVLTVLLYGQTVRYGFVYEDSNDPETFFSMSRTAGNRWITAETYKMSQRISGLEPWGFHLGNIGVHVVNTFLLADVLPITWGAALAVGLFALHPLQVESVAYISNRADLLARQWWLVSVFALGALLTKETGVMVLPMVALYGWWYRVPVTKGAWIGGGLVALCGLALAWRFGVSLDGGWFATETTKALWLLSRLVFPMNLSVDHAWEWITPVVAVCGMVVGMFLFGWSLRSRTTGFVACWIVLSLLPRLIVPLYEGMHEHHLYGALLGLSLGVGSIAPVSRS